MSTAFVILSLATNLTGQPSNNIVTVNSLRLGDNYQFQSTSRTVIEEASILRQERELVAAPM